MPPTFRIVSLGAVHDRARLSCGAEPLDRYLATRAGQDVQRRVSTCFVALPEDEITVAGFYTLAATSTPVQDLPTEQTRRLPRYPVLLAALIGRLAAIETSEQCNWGQLSSSMRS